jgi:PPOX class probable F420-dependent enzyme
MLDPAIRDLAQGKNYATISFHLANGSIGTHVMWVHADDEHILINTEVHRAKYKAIQSNPNVTVVVWDNANPYSYAEVRGTVTGEVRGAEALASINELSHKYSGVDYGNEIQSERVILQITPDRQRAPGH